MKKESDFRMLEGVKPGAELDSRFPEFFQESIPQGVRVLTELFAGASRCQSHPSNI